jgi:SAM-dependent methyltransferase
MKSRVKSLFSRLRLLVHPENKLVVRQRVSHKFIRGNGVEIGALHDPLWVSPEANVRYVDIMTMAEASQIFPSLSGLVNPDIIDDGETLSTIDDESLDFIIANHFLEHCINPLGTMRNHLAKLKSGGVLYYAVPNKDLTFDKERAITSFEHLLKDDREGGEVSKRVHYLDYA